MEQEPKLLACKIVEEVYGRGDVALLDSLCAPGYVWHDSLAGEGSCQTAQHSVRLLHDVFPDIDAKVLQAFEDDNTGIVQWRISASHSKPLLGIPPTGRRVSIQCICIFRFADGKLVEGWTQWNALGLLHQLGITPSLWRPPPEGEAGGGTQMHS